MPDGAGLFIPERSRIFGCEIAVCSSNRFQQRKDFLHIQGGQQFQPHLLEVGQSLEVVGEMPAHLIDPHRFGLNFQRFGEL